MTWCRPFLTSFVMFSMAATLVLCTSACATGDSRTEPRAAESKQSEDENSNDNRATELQVEFPVEGEPDGGFQQRLADLEYVAERVEADDQPEEVRQWVQRAKQIPGGHTFTHDDKRYILVTLGLQSSPGFDIELTDFHSIGSRLGILFETSEPTDEQQQTHLFEYPYDLAVLSDEIEPIDPSDDLVMPDGNWKMFENNGDLPEIRGGSTEMVLFEPASEQRVDEQVYIHGAGHGYEGSVVYEFWSGTEKIEKGSISGASPRDHYWHAFDAKIDIPEVDENRFPELFGDEYEMYLSEDHTGHPHLELRLYPTDPIEAAGGGLQQAPQPEIVIELDHHPGAN